MDDLRIALSDALTRSVETLQDEWEPHDVPSPSGIASCRLRQWFDGKRIPRSNRIPAASIKKMQYGKAIEEFWRTAYERLGFSLLGSLSRVPIGQHMTGEGDGILVAMKDIKLDGVTIPSGRSYLLELKDLGLWSYLSFYQKGAEEGLPEYWAQVQCFTPSTRILTADLQWFPIGDLNEGDILIGCDEVGKPGCPRHLRPSVVEAVARRMAPVGALILADGSHIITTYDHPFFRPSNTDCGGWVTVDTIIRRHRKLHRAFPTWKPNNEWESGWLAGMVDGEGCLSIPSDSHNSLVLTISQKPGPVLQSIQDRLLKYGFDSHHVPRNGQGSAAETLRGGRNEVARFLGTIRPQRLLQRWGDALTEGRMALQTTPIDVVRWIPLGVQEVVNLQTSIGTYIAEGFPVHNCYMEGYDLDACILHAGQADASAVTYIWNQRKERNGWPDKPPPFLLEVIPRLPQELAHWSAVAQEVRYYIDNYNTMPVAIRDFDPFKTRYPCQYCGWWTLCQRGVVEEEVGVSDDEIDQAARSGAKAA